MTSNQSNTAEGKRKPCPRSRYSPSLFKGNQSEKKDVVKLKHRSMSCPPASPPKNEESDEEQPPEERKRRTHRPTKRYSPSPPNLVKEEKISESSVRDQRMQSTNVDGSGPGPSTAAPLRSPSQKPRQPSKRIVKPNSKYGYIPFSISTTRTTTTNSSIADPPPQKKIKMMLLKVKEEVMEPDEVDPLSSPALKRGRGRPKKEQAVDLHEEDSEDDQADDEPQTEPVRKRGRPPRRAISSGPSTSVAANVQEPPKKRGRPPRRSTASPVSNAVKDEPSTSSSNQTHHSRRRSNRLVMREEEEATDEAAAGRLAANSMYEMEGDSRRTPQSFLLNGFVEVKTEPIEEAEEEPADNARDEIEFEEPMDARGITHADEFVANDDEEMEGVSRQTRQRSNVKKENEATELDSDDDEAPEEPEPVYNARNRIKIQVPQSQNSNDLNADGTGPGCSSAPTVPQIRASNRLKDRNADGSAPGPSNAPARIQSLPPRQRSRPPASPSPSTTNSENEEEENYRIVRRPLRVQEGLGEFTSCRGCEKCGIPEEDENVPIITDDPNFQIPPEALRLFEEAAKQTTKQWNMSHKDLAEVYSVLKPETEARLPRKIHFSKFLMETVYGSPFPREYRHAKTLYICEFCMFYAREDRVMKMHAGGKCQWRAPPGVEIYRKDNISIFEVDGNKQKRYCESLSLLSRCFLQSKSIFWDTALFFFYIITQNDEVGCHFAGYFSKEKYESENNVNCIVALPCYQAQGYGRFLIDVSYALSRKEENWTAGPELPFSELGERAYASYWRTAVAKALADFKEDIEGRSGDGISVVDITHATGINVHDVLKTLNDLKWIKLEKGENKKENTNVVNFGWDVNWKAVEDIIQQVRTSTRPQFDENFLDWTPTVRTPGMDGFVDPNAVDEGVEVEVEEPEEEEEPVVVKNKKKNNKKKK
ncbi:unnamed protein product [Caenorhabditis brenneri]